ncbi:hypothetical protein Cantr_05947 [Candida viswanathii]|uniref:Trafficking protein particle complex subunit 2-like protein n=1 Tax=Candida viswanathii TaxID=5486 RepID=A0A367XRU8_9ASCO|nr:hypothetical protein Cantr_05947 [Candida viswanathii]
MSESTTVEKSIDQETTTNTNPIQFISLISRTDRPLYIQAFNIDDDALKTTTNKETTTTATNANANKFLKFNFLSHMALDIFASPSSLSLREQQSQSQHQQSKGGSGGAGDISTILLFIQDQVMVYGYETNNGLKIVVGLDQNYLIDQKSLDKLFLDVHKCYLRTIFNPLNSIANDGSGDAADDGEILLQSSTFDKNIKNLVSSYV